MLRNDLLAVVAEKAAKYGINQGGRSLSCRDPVGPFGKVDFNQGLSQSGQIGATKGDPACGVSRFQAGNSDQAGGIGQISDDDRPASERSSICPDKSTVSGKRS